MPKVSVLPDHIASQIAAGEVVERPSSVVKELVENSIDAGATQVEISIDSDCRDIRIADNGSGMAADDAVLAFHRHATSKLSKAEDLWSLNTMGFRGEALPSISSISRMVCYTRPANATSGTKVEVIDGKIIATETGCAAGTVMEITDLFYNVPARMKFLKKPATEYAHIQETVQSLAIAHPKTAFVLRHKGQVVMKTSGSGQLAQAMKESGLLSGKEELLEVSYQDPESQLSISGFVARPIHFRGDRKNIVCIVNNRPVRCPITFKALDYAYSDLIPRGKYPIAVLNMTLDARQVDVNVHPTKKEVKYSQGNDVYLALQRALIEAVRYQPTIADQSVPIGSFLRPPTTAGEDARAPGLGANTSIDGTGDNTYTPGFATAGYQQQEDFAPSMVREQLAANATNFAPAARTPAQQLQFAEELSYVPPAPRHAAPFAAPAPVTQSRTGATLPAGWRLLGYLHNMYFLVETPEGLEIIEQHIAHERTIYERLLANQTTAGRNNQNNQPLVISVPLQLTPEQTTLIRDNLESLHKLGFDFDVNGAEVTCTQVPLELAHKDYAVVVQRMLDDLSITDNAAFELEATKSIACQTAIKNGMLLSESDIIQLLHDWHKTPRNDTCPHGRPVRLKFSLDKLFQLFHPA